MDDPHRHSLDHRVRFDECDADGIVRPSALLRAMQDLAWQHSDATGYDRAWYQEHGLTWLVRFVDLQVDVPIHSGETIRLTTHIAGWRRVWARRRTEVERVQDGDRPERGDRPESGVAVATATIDWVLIDAAGRPARVPAGIAERFADGAPTFTPGRVILSEQPADAVARSWEVGVRDLDPMRHVNNATYLDQVDEALAASTGALTGPHPPVRYLVEYLRPALPHQIVTLGHWTVDGEAMVRFATPDGAELVRALVGRRHPHGGLFASGAPIAHDLDDALDGFGEH
ncbi:MAG: hypothetical protein KF809_14525 [Chloroflexi bacterium]|nr:hypothetical protein [Chloroflexota bacterium]